MRIIFIDDEPRSTQIKDYLDELCLNNVNIGPTKNWQIEFQDSLHSGVFHGVDGAIKYFDKLVKSDYEWNAIDGMIVDALMPPGKFLPRVYPQLVSDHSLTGAMLIEYLSAKILESEINKKKSNRYATPIYLLSNLAIDIMDTWADAYERLEVDFNRKNQEIFFPDSTIEIRYRSKITSDIAGFVHEFKTWMRKKRESR